MYDTLSSSMAPAEHRYRRVSDLAYAGLRERIIRGDIAPGERIDQDAEAKRYDVSRMPIREALRRLEAEELVESVPHRGTLVRPLNANDLTELYDLRQALEGLASRLGVPELTDDDLGRMRGVLPEMEEIVRNGPASAWLQVDWQFHYVMYAAAQRTRLLRIIWMLWEEGSRYRRLRLHLPNELQVSLDGHYRILTACERRDGAEVERLVTDTLQESRVKLLRALRSDDWDEGSGLTQSQRGAKA